MNPILHEPPSVQLLHGGPWHSYEFFLTRLDGQHLRITYDRGELEIASLSHEHHFWSSLIGAVVGVLTLELNIAIHSGGSTTLYRSRKKRGIEPDECYWIQNERHMRCKTDFDIETDPPPDLVVEIEVTRSSLNRMRILAALRVPEIWRFDGESLSVHLLAVNGKYNESPTSRAFPLVPIAEIERFLHESSTTDETTLLRSFSKWVRETIAPASSGKSKKNGNGKKSRK